MCLIHETVLCPSVQVLRWYGYFKEAVTESAVENYRVRKVVIFFYLEDNSCQVVEPKEDNSGLPQVLPCPLAPPQVSLPCPKSRSALRYSMSSCLTQDPLQHQQDPRTLLYEWSCTASSITGPTNPSKWLLQQ